LQVPFERLGRLVEALAIEVRFSFKYGGSAWVAFDGRAACDGFFT